MKKTNKHTEERNYIKLHGKKTPLYTTHHRQNMQKKKLKF